MEDLAVDKQTAVEGVCSKTCALGLEREWLVLSGSCLVGEVEASAWPGAICQDRQKPTEFMKQWMNE